MITLITVIVFAVALGLLATGIYYQLNREKLASDPVLIRSCYLGGSVLLLGNLIVPGL
jgi:hypothetical protein